MEHLRVIDTGDGSNSLLHTTLQETYHSVHGAVRESTHVFIDHGLRVAEARQPGRTIAVLEIGFGTGLNALLTLEEARRSRLAITYESWETYPLPESIWSQLNYGTIVGDTPAFQSIHAAAWDVRVLVDPAMELYKRNRDLTLHDPEGAFDLVYYDAFAPSRQPEMWTPAILSKVTRVLKPGGIWVTYCAKGQVKRDLAALGLTVETLPGAPGKKEMTRAQMPSPSRP